MVALEKSRLGRGVIFRVSHEWLAEAERPSFSVGSDDVGSDQIGSDAAGPSDEVGSDEVGNGVVSDSDL